MFFFFFFQTNAMQSVASSQQQWKVFLPFYSGTALHVNVNMLMGLTSYEGSLEQNSYPHRFNEKNFMSAYKEWPSELYHELKDINGAELDTLARRKFHQLACANKFQPHFDQITNEEAIAISLAIYGDIGFRVPGIAHAR